MWTLLLGLILGLLAPVHSHPVPVFKSDPSLTAGPLDATNATSSSNENAPGFGHLETTSWIISDLEAWSSTSDPEGSTDEMEGSTEQASTGAGNPSQTPISELEEEGLISLSPLPRFSPTGPSQTQGLSHVASSTLTSMAGLQRARAAKMDTERPTTEQPFTSTGSSASATTVWTHTDMDESGSGVVHTTGTTVTDSTDQILGSPVNEEPIERKDGKHTKVSADILEVPHQAPDLKPTPSARSDAFTAGWWIIPVFVLGIVIMFSICIVIVISKSWTRKAQTEKNEMAKATSGDEHEKKRFLSNGRPKENSCIGQYSIIPLKEIPEKEPLD
ncbi:uncharacterized protein LOC105025305 [Esox lucius]|uniref:uncharacterized protein LOC105025305 n=1 Tax=Esox lucius TaxID=8010 RepID=UPI00147723E3|nr:uncharacterized protein LOC105025305 [Esox lucius]